VTVAPGYGGGSPRVPLPAETAVWSHAGTPGVPMRGGVRRAPHGRVAPHAVRATNPRLAPAQILTSVVRRWPLEPPVADARAHRGVETPRQGSQQAPARTPPAWLARDSRVPVMAAPLVGTTTMPGRTAAWDAQAHATVSETLA